ncbi:APO protein 3 mitochondrial-like [Quillaja saponaria]|uniref:APO protein 3 mitochondrial-like n=1 Tax=Quillaja saponaria TaxID=32244 RepID=A0AAD7LW99_QUISA|nr:APO protein 3 mitochondrial-like [Quillaja saponaria]
MDDSLYSDIPNPPTKKSEGEPYPTPMKVLIQKGKEERESRKAQPVRMLEEPPDNGLLVPELVECIKLVGHSSLVYRKSFKSFLSNVQVASSLL